MKQYLISTALVTSLASGALAQSLEDTVEMGLTALDAMGAGLTIGGQDVTADGSVVLNDVVLAPDGPDDVTISSPRITLSPDGDAPGGVIVTTTRLVISDPSADAPIEVVIEGEGFAITTNWMAAMNGAPSVTVVADRLSASGGNEAHPFLKALNLGVDGLDIGFDGQFASRSGEFTFAVDNMTADYIITDPFDGTRQDVAFTYQGYEFAVSAENLPEGEDDIERFVDEDGAFSMTAASGPVSMDMDIDIEGTPLAMSGTGDGGDVEISFIDGRVVYRGTGEAVAYSIATDPAVLPLPPIDISYSGVEMDITAPIRPTEGPEPVRLKFEFSDLTVSDAAWGLFDPEGKLPRDPATLDIDIAASVDINMPLFEALDDDGEGDAPSPLMLGTVERVDMTRVFLTAAGATAEATGAVDLLYQGPFPLPEGQINISLAGIQTLANTIGELGLLPAEEIAPMMGMMMMFAQPGDGPDTFTSQIEFKDGGITANGIPLQ
ncbi:MAG: DUF2125 domain-containing protein [Pseudomonadota bacterium]